MEADRVDPRAYPKREPRNMLETLRAGVEYNIELAVIHASGGLL
jgi:hypothetical protein